MATFETKERTEKMKSRADSTLQRLETLRLYSLTEIEPIVGVSHRTLMRYVYDGKLKAVKIGGKWKVSEEALKKFINGED